MIRKIRSGEMWGITTYFSTNNSSIRLRNYRIFRKSLRLQGLPLVTVELAYDDNPFQLREGIDAEILVQLRSHSIMWQKERLLNVALEHLPASCRYVCWLDSDIIFADDKWVAKSIKKLRKHKVIQPCRNLIYLSNESTGDTVHAKTLDLKESDLSRTKISFAYFFLNSPEKFTKNIFKSKALNLLFNPKIIKSPVFYYIKKKSVSLRLYDPLKKIFINKDLFFTGMVWCIRRELIDGFRFYDRCIIGGGDAVMADAFTGRHYYSLPFLRIKGLSDDISSWSKKVFSVVNSDVSYIDGTIYHLWHGDLSTRTSVERLKVLEDHRFDPNKDIRLSRNHCFEWSTSKTDMVNGVKIYILGRDVK